MKYRKKPVEVEALLWDGTLGKEKAIRAFAQEAEMQSSEAVLWFSYETIHIRTLEGVMKANLGDWIIKGIKGELYPCKPDIFEATYEPVMEYATKMVEIAPNVYRPERVPIEELNRND